MSIRSAIAVAVASLPAAAVWPPAAGSGGVLASDPNYAKCTVLLHFNGADGSTNFVDQIGNLWTASGDAKISTSSPLYGSSSGLFDGSGDYISADIASAIGTGDFTVRGKIRPASVASDGELFCIGNPSNTSQFNLVIEIKSGGYLRASIQDGSGGAQADVTTGAAVFTAGTDYDFAVAADGGTLRLYVGPMGGTCTQVASTSIVGTRAQTNNQVRVGYLASGFARHFNGRMKGLQVYNGVCLYPGGTSFTAPPNSDRPSFPALVYGDRIATATTNDAQGVADDGTNLYFASSTTLYKYSKAGTLLSSRSTASDEPAGRTQINGLFWRAGVLYVSAAKWDAGSSVASSWVCEYDPSTLTPLGSPHVLDVSGMSQGGFSEGLAWYGGFWWVIFHANKKVAVYTSDFATRVALLDLAFSITGSSGGYGSGTGYDGIAWVGDYLLCNVHEIYNEKFLDVYFWNGATLDMVTRVRRSRSGESQGLALDPSDSTVLRLAERGVSGDGVARRVVT